MLVAQAKRACELFTGGEIGDLRLEQVYRQVAAGVTNLVLTGMPGSGKSTVGRALADRLNRPFFDADEEIVRAAGMSIPEIFRTQGEQEFRELETQVLSELGKRSGVVISTGGGAVLFERNLPLLRQNGRVYRLSRRLEALATEGRPLSASPEKLRQMELEREPFYSAAADVTVENNGSLEKAVKEILDDFNR